MDTTKNSDHNLEIEKVRKLLSQNIDEFKYLALSNMRLGENSKSSKETLRLDVNRISDFEQNKTESLEEWVGREFAPKTDKKPGSAFTYDVAGETLEHWVKRQKVQPKNKNTRPTIIDNIEQWLMNEAKKDLFAEMDAKFGSPEGFSSDYIRDLGQSLISLADKLDKMKSKSSGV